jgi:16S rRNA (uracil1498-N3)-methyltransferase
MIRIYCSQKIDENLYVNLDHKQHHYLYNVMRRKNGDAIIIFNQVDGEWSGVLESKRVLIKDKKRDRLPSANKSIAVGSIKKHRMEIIVEKTTELGIDNIYLLATDHTQEVFYNYERLRAISIEAAEQSGRICVPTIHKAQKIGDFLHKGFELVVMSPSENVHIGQIHGCPMIGPEGGFSTREIDMLKNFPHVSLNKNILRAETAAIVAASLL